MTDGTALPSVPPLSDAELVTRLRTGDMSLFEELMRRFNQRLYRVARAITRNNLDAEDVLQQAYINAYLHLDQFEGRSQLSTWLTRIVIAEALGRRRRSGVPFESIETHERVMAQIDTATPDPERLAYAQELRALLEAAIDTLPDSYRIVFVCRDLEGMSTTETAAALDLGEEAVKTRLHRARAMLRRDLLARAEATTADAFAFGAQRCDALVAHVLQRLGSGPPQNSL